MEFGKSTTFLKALHTLKNTECTSWGNVFERTERREIQVMIFCQKSGRFSYFTLTLKNHLYPLADFKVQQTVEVIFFNKKLELLQSHKRKKSLLLENLLVFLFQIFLPMSHFSSLVSPSWLVNLADPCHLPFFFVPSRHAPDAPFKMALPFFTPWSYWKSSRCPAFQKYVAGPCFTPLT